MKHTPFTLLIETATPFAIGVHAVNLDAILYACIGARWNLSDPDAIHNRLKQYLAFDDAAGVYKASSMMMVATPDRGVNVISTQRPDNIRSNMAPDLYTSKKKVINIIGGPYKRRLTSRESYSAPFVAFHVVGSSDEIVALLENHMCGIGVDATTAAFGEPISFQVYHKDSVTWDSSNGMAMRPLPESLGNTLGVEGNVRPLALTPPYHSVALEAGYSPKRINIKIFDDLV